MKRAAMRSPQHVVAQILLCVIRRNVAPLDHLHSISRVLNIEQERPFSAPLMLYL